MNEINHKVINFDMEAIDDVALSCSGTEQLQASGKDDTFWDPPDSATANQLSPEEEQKKLEKKERNEEAAQRNQKKKKKNDDKLKADPIALKEIQKLTNEVTRLSLQDEKYKLFPDDHDCMKMMPLPHQQDHGDNFYQETGRNVASDLQLSMPYKSTQNLTFGQSASILRDDRSQIVTAQTYYEKNECNVMKGSLHGINSNSIEIMTRTMRDDRGIIVSGSRGPVDIAANPNVPNVTSGSTNIGPATNVQSFVTSGSVNKTLTTNAPYVTNVMVGSSRSFTASFNVRTGSECRSSYAWTTTTYADSESREEREGYGPPPVKKPRLE